MSALFTTIPITHMAREYVPSHMQTSARLTETFRRHEPIRVCPIHPQHAYGDDYDRVQSEDWLDRGFKQ